LPPTDRDNIYVNIKYINKINFQQNLEFTNKIYSRTKQFFGRYYPGIVKHIQITIGDRQTFSPLDSAVYRNSFNPELAKLNIVLIPSSQRTDKQNAVKIYPKLNSFLKEKLKNDKKLSFYIKELNAFIQKS